MAEGLLQAMGRKCILLNVPSWQETKMCVALSQIISPDKKPLWWLTVCVEGSKSPQYATEIFEKILRKNKILPWPPRTQTKKGTKEKESFKFKGFQVFYDGSGCTDPHLGGAGALQFSGKGKRFVVGLKPSLLGPTILVNLQAV